jgi:hypothetical protein
MLAGRLSGAIGAVEEWHAAITPPMSADIRPRVRDHLRRAV